MILLINPPVTKPCEPPGGLVQIAGALEEAGVSFRVWDASLEGLFYLIQWAVIDDKDDTWARRALSHRFSHLTSFRDFDLYKNLARYRRAVSDLTRILKVGAQRKGVKVGLADYRDPSCLPISTTDLLRAAEHPEITPFYPFYLTRLIDILEEKEPRLVGISLNFLSQAVNSFALAGLLRKLIPSARLVLGGSLVTTWSSRLKGNNPFQGLIDDLVAGPGEGPLLSMVGKEGSKEATHLTLQGFPLSYYLSPLPVLPIALSRGCYYRQCRFCPERSEGHVYRALNGQDMEKRIMSLLKKYPSSFIHLLDTALSPHHLKEMVKLSPPVKWYAFARITEEIADVDFTRALKKSGCLMLKLGVESGSQKVLDSLEKGISLSTVSRTLFALKEAGIATYVYLLFGTPEEGESEARETMHFVLEHADAISYLNASIFNLPVGSRPDLKCQPFYPGDLSLYEDFAHPLGWHRRKVRLFLSQEFKSAKPIGNILLRTPPVFTSNHAPFFGYASDDALDQK
ncbi:MAG: radical SAM protein [Syntrophales bacterium]|nr:radical SAM protein [Syntrophales bacterium]